MYVWTAISCAPPPFLELWSSQCPQPVVEERSTEDSLQGVSESAGEAVEEEPRAQVAEKLARVREDSWNCCSIAHGHAAIATCTGGCVGHA